MIIAVAVLVVIILLLLIYNIIISGRIKNFKDINQKVTSLNVLQDFMSTVGDVMSVDEKQRSWKWKGGNKNGSISETC